MKRHDRHLPRKSFAMSRFLPRSETQTAAPRGPHPSVRQQKSGQRRASRLSLFWRHQTEPVSGKKSAQINRLMGQIGDTIRHRSECGKCRVSVAWRQLACPGYRRQPAAKRQNPIWKSRKSRKFRARVRATSPRAAGTSGSPRHCRRSSGRTWCRGRAAG